MFPMSMYKMKEHDVDQIIPNLWLGNYIAALNKTFLDNHNIKYILNVTPDISCPFSDKIYMRISIHDKSSYVCYNEDMQNVIDNSLKFILNALQQNVGVLVHCRKGHHRSAGIVMAFLMKYLNMSYLHSMTYINSIRPYALVRKTCIGNQIYKYYINNL